MIGEAKDNFGSKFVKSTFPLIALKKSTRHEDDPLRGFITRAGVISATRSVFFIFYQIIPQTKGCSISEVAGIMSDSSTSNALDIHFFKQQLLK